MGFKFKNDVNFYIDSLTPEMLKETFEEYGFTLEDEEKSVKVKHGFIRQVSPIPAIKELIYSGSNVIMNTSPYTVVVGGLDISETVSFSKMTEVESHPLSARFERMNIGQINLTGVS